MNVIKLLISQKIDMNVTAALLPFLFSTPRIILSTIH